MGGGGGRVSFCVPLLSFSFSLFLSHPQLPRTEKINLPPTCNSTTLHTTASNPSNAASSSPPPDERDDDDTARALSARPSTSSAYAAASGVP